MNPKLLRTLPLFLLLLLSLALAMGLIHGKPPKDRDASMVGRKVIPFEVPALPAPGETQTGFSPNTWKGHVAVLSVFASWCVPCAAEHPVLMKLAATGKVPIYGLAWKDTPEKIAAWLKVNGNPYRRVGVDEFGRSTVLLGLTGVPELFVIGRDGTIFYHHRSPVDDYTVNNVILPMVERLEGGDAK